MNLIEIEKTIVSKWQSVVDIMAELINVPAALIMKISGSDIEVFVASQSTENPYHPGDKEHLIGSGLYCETVIKTKSKLLIPNAMTDEKWNKNPDIKLGMISYIGFPLIFPTGEVFGTICVLDNKENHYLKIYEKLILQFRELIESHLLLVHQNHELNKVNKALAERIAEIKILRKIIPICSFCKKIRDDKGYWKAVETYLREHSETKFTHGICLECLKNHYPEIYEKNRVKYQKEGYT